jgi:hypothetical protein
MDSPPTSHPSDHIQCLITSKLFGYWTGVLCNVKRFVFGDPVFVTDEPRPDAATLARLLIVCPILLLGCCVLWVCIVLSAIEWFVRYCVLAVIELSGVIVRGFSLIGRLCYHFFGIIIGRRSTIASIEQHALWDRWLDG